MYKVCFKCGRLLPLSEYYKHCKMADGHLNKCKECTKNDIHEYRNNNKEKVQAYDRNRPNHKDRIKNNKERLKTLKETDPALFSERRKRRAGDYKNKFPNKYKARNAVNNAVRDGLLTKVTLCENCGSEHKIQAHHESYEENKWLDVVWLCDCCHKNRHKIINEQLRYGEEVTKITIPF